MILSRETSAASTVAAPQHGSFAMGIRKVAAITLAIGVPAALGLGAVLAWTSANSASADDYAWFDEVIEVKHLIGQRYVDKADEQKLKEGAIRGMVEALNDPYTVYVPKGDAQDFTKDLTGEYVGIGATVNLRDGYLRIVSPLEDSPSYRAGLMPDDLVKSIDGKSTNGLTVEQCVDLLLGEPSTTVKLVIERDGKEFDQQITRERIKTRAVKGVRRDATNPENWDFILDPSRNIAYVRLTQFTPECSTEVANAVATASAKKPLGGLVLDLRSNPGGLLMEAERIADLFLNEGVIVSTKGRAFDEKVTRAEKRGTLPDFPIAVIVNGDSASASEVLSGALVENNRAIIVGTRSFGKGSVQSVIGLANGGGSELKLTEQGYFLPSGRSITRKDDSPTWGVDPTDGYYVPVTDKELIAMFEAQRKQELLRKSPATANTPSPNAPSADATSPATPTPTFDTVDRSGSEWVVTLLADKQLAAALKAVQGRADTGEWPKTGEKSLDSTRIATDELQRARLVRDRLERELIRIDKRISAIESVADSKATGARDLWSDDLNLTDGEVDVRDKDGKLIAKLRITGNTLERWLVDADVEKIGGVPTPEPKPEPKPEAKPEAPK